MDSNEKDIRKRKIVSGKEFAYFDLLVDNSPQAYTNPKESNYNSEAAILHRQIDKNENVLNLALVAKLGAGKSSVIKTYLKSYRNKKGGRAGNNKFARISLATYNETELDEQAIERSILQQLLYSQKKSKLPNSKIARTNKTPLKQSLWRGLLATILVMSAVLFGIELGDKKFIGPSWVKFLLQIMLL